MDYRIEGPWIIFDDGTCMASISGAQENFSAIEFQSAAGQLVDDMRVDYVLNVGGDVSGTGGIALSDAGVPYGGDYAAGYTGLSDAIRSGYDPETYIASVNSGSLSDILRGGGESPGFDPNAFNPNSPTVSADWNITDLIGSITKGVATIGGVVLGAIGASKSAGSQSGPGSNTGTQGSSQPLAQRLFGGLTPGASGNVPSLLLYGSLAAIAAMLLFMLGKQARV